MIVTTQLNVPAPDPLAATVHVPIGVTLAPAPIVKEIVADGVKLAPAIVTWTPLGPCPGVSEMAGGLSVVIVNGAWAESELPSEPVAVSVYVPVLPVVSAIVTTQLNVPALDPLDTTVHVPLDVTLAPALIENAIVADGVKPEPTTVTWVPLGPWLGVRRIARVGVVRVNCACAESKPPSDPVAVTV